MKKIRLLFVLLVFYSINGFSQEEDENTSLMPRVAPVSPEAASLGKYGDLPVNLATGRLNFTIPIYTIKVDDFELPIYLSYNYSGLLAEEDPGMAGLGWTLNAGGMVIRQLRGRPDEEVGGMGYVRGNIGIDHVIPFSFGQWHGDDLKSKEYTLFHMSETNNADTQPDKFIINVGNLSGNFSFNELGDAIFYPYKNYIVSLTSDKKFKIIDNKGIRYYFYDKEETYLDPNTSNEIDNPPMDYVSGWRITNIILPNTDNSIDFEYYPLSIDSNYSKIGYSESLSHILVSTITGDSHTCSQYVDPLISVSMNETSVNQKSVKKISFPDGSVEFDVRTVPQNSHARNKKYLHGIKVYNKDNQLINSYKFFYDDLMSNFKLLQEIKKFGKNGTKIPFYKMEYKGTPPREIYYASQDTWGFYNGRYNSRLIYGDRTVVFEKASLGALKKITYPTGGYSKINYESNRVKELFGAFDNGGTCLSTPINRTINVDALSLSNPNSSMNNPNPPDKTLVIPVNQTIRVTVYAGVGGNQGMAQSEAGVDNVNGGTHHWECNPFITSCNDDCANGIQAWQEQGGGVNEGGNIPGGQKTSYFRVKEGTILKLSASASSQNAFAGAGAIVDYFDGNLPPEDNYIEVGGIRVASTEDCSEKNDCISKRYKYVMENGISSGKILSFPYYTRRYKIVSEGSINSGICSCDVEQWFSSSRVPLASFQGAPVLYERIETYENANQVKGKDVKYYTSINNFASPMYPFPPKDTKDWKKGLLKKEEIYKWNNNQFEMVKKIENNYEELYPYPTDFNLHKFSIGVVAGRSHFTYEMRGLLDGDPREYTSNTFNNRPVFYHLKITKETDVLNDSIVKTTYYDYDQYTGNLIKQETTNSKGDTIKLKTFYPDDVNNVASLGNKNLTAAELNAYKLLQQPDNNHPNRQNRISEPVQTEQYINNQQVSVQRTTYKNWGAVHNENNKRIVTPEKILQSKGGNNLKQRVVYHKYDPYGNPTEVSKADGTHIYYIWGYQHTQPIAKIVNFTSAQAASIQNYINEAITASDNDIDKNTENNLRNKLEIIRNALPADAQMSGFTYDPLVGVTSITDQKGDVQYFIYDEFNRLKQVKDKDGNILKENEYHYVPIPEPPTPIQGSISVVNHNISGSNVSFSADIESGPGSYTYEWSVISGGVANGSTTNRNFSVGYTCAPGAAHISVKCIVRDASDPDNNLSLSKYFKWSCLSNGHLRVTLDYDEDTSGGGGGGRSVIYTLSNVDFRVSDVYGGSDDLTYKWYYKEAGSNNYVLLGTSSVPSYTLTGAALDPNPFPCRSAVTMRCVVIDNVNGQTHAVDEYLIHEILCGPQ